MSAYDFYKRKMKIDTCSTGKNYPTLGEKLKSDSDMLMELTWDSDVQSKVAYIYDYWHDDQPDIKDHMTYENTTKTRIDIKLIVKSYSSMDQDQPEFYCQFKPFQKLEFDKGDELYYFETEYRQKYDIEFPIGMMLDIPDDRGVYRKWLICEKELANQFPKYLILPIDYQFMWIEKDGKDIFKRKMWGVNRSQKSYTIGEYRDRYFARPDNQKKAILPLNSITENIWYTDKEEENLRMVVSAKTKHPIVWRVTKVENTQPLGLQTLTFYQNYWDEHIDKIEYDKNGRVIGAWADYYKTNLTPIEEIPTPTPAPTPITSTINASTPYIKVGGSYKILTVNLFNDSHEDITSKYSDATFEWTCDIDGEDWTDIVTWRDGTDFNQKKIKFANDKSQLKKILNINCKITQNDEVIEPKTLRLEITN
ncbi:hypothetical protein [uncultured Eubacterium sp.]|uniref:hypothetical protein n=1 Tax=uncultured Eubacterium sp. TaxID=165185 RepID=UPI002599E1A2|nr:hypothetical protein [uncultured Eubacterium sp.]